MVFLVDDLAIVMIPSMKLMLTTQWIHDGNNCNMNIYIIHTIILNRSFYFHHTMTTKTIYQIL